MFNKLGCVSKIIINIVGNDKRVLLKGTNFFQKGLIIKDGGNIKENLSELNYEITS